MSHDALIQVNNLRKEFHVGKNLSVKAVDGVSFSIKRGETLGLVGESGCGKTTCGRTLLNLYPPSGGQVLYKGKNIYEFSKAEMKEYRKHCQIVLQDPYASLNPRMTVRSIISEGLRIHNMMNEDQQTERVYELLELVGLNREHANRFPHEFSGGQRQRIGIARALAVNPEFIVCDEPISALDVSIQAQVVNLLIQLQRDLGLTYLFIAHDLSMVKHISDRVAVMYLGSLVELAPCKILYDNPRHPYTEALLSAIPIPDPQVEESRERIMLEGDVPSPIHLPKGCKFAGRCARAKEICHEEIPQLKELDQGHFIACHLV